MMNPLKSWAMTLSTNIEAIAERLDVMLKTERKPEYVEPNRTAPQQQELETDAEYHARVRVWYKERYIHMQKLAREYNHG
jgi:hypothetical protein